MIPGLSFPVLYSLTTRPIFLVPILLLVFTALWVGLAPWVLANGGVDTRTIFEEGVGGYGVVVTVTPGRPTEGLVHLTFRVSDAETEAIIKDATLELNAVPPAESELGEASFSIEKSEVNPDLYDVDVRLEAEGVWELELFIEGPRGREQVEIPLEVRGPASKIFAILIVVLAFPLLLALLEIWRRWDRRKKKSQRIEGWDVTETGDMEDSEEERT